MLLNQVKAGYAHDEDASTVSRQIANRVLQLKRAREQRKQAVKTPSLPAQTTDCSVQTNFSGTAPLHACSDPVAVSNAGNTNHNTVT